MRGLLRNNFYTMGTNLQLAFGISFILMFVPIIVGDSVISMILGMQSFMFIANIGSALNIDVTSKWSRFEVTMPVKRNDIVKARYISFIILISCGVLMSTLTVLLSVSLLETITVDAITFGFSFGVSFSLITSSLMYPAMLKIGTEKNELIIFICAGIAVALFLLVLFAVSPLIPIMPTSLSVGKQTIIGISFFMLAVIIFICSYFISLRMYKKKEL